MSHFPYESEEEDVPATPSTTSSHARGQTAKATQAIQALMEQSSQLYCHFPTECMGQSTSFESDLVKKYEDKPRNVFYSASNPAPTSRFQTRCDGLLETERIYSNLQLGSKSTSAPHSKQGELKILSESGRSSVVVTCSSEAEEMFLHGTKYSTKSACLNLVHSSATERKPTQSSSSQSEDEDDQK